MNTNEPDDGFIITEVVPYPDSDLFRQIELDHERIALREDLVDYDNFTDKYDDLDFEIQINS